MKIKDLFGQPKEGFHKKRFIGMALYDLIGTIFLALLFSSLTRISILYCVITFFLLGIFCHYVFNVDTTINKILFSKKN